MYKAASRNMQHVIGRDTSKRYRPYEPRSRAATRKWWFPVIEHHGSIDGIKQAYGRKFPAWLLAEIASFTCVRWLGYWSRTTGKPKKIGASR